MPFAKLDMKKLREMPFPVPKELYSGFGKAKTMTILDNYPNENSVGADESSKFYLKKQKKTF